MLPNNLKKLILRIGAPISHSSRKTAMDPSGAPAVEVGTRKQLFADTAMLTLEQSLADLYLPLLPPTVPPLQKT